MWLASHSRARRRRGLALVFVLWIMAVLSAVALQMSFSTHLRTQATAGLSGGVKGLYLARGGVERAIAFLTQEPYKAQSLNDLHETEQVAFSNVELGDGAYTLYAGADDSGQPVYGLMDESAKLNLATASAEVLNKLPNIDPLVVQAIINRREQQAFVDLSELLTIEGITPAMLYGEDRNRNGILNANENDGDDSWPPDNADGRLDEGLARFLTVCSSSRNISAAGTKRVDLNSASADALRQGLPDLTDMEAQSIIQYREKNKFASIANLADVDLVEKVQQQSGDNTQQNSANNRNGRRNNRNNRNNNANQQQNQNQSQNQNNSNSDQKSSTDAQSKQTADTSKTDQKQGDQAKKEEYRSTGKKAFDVARCRKMADSVAITSDETVAGLVNINTAPAEVLVCLPGMTDELADSILVWRRNQTQAFQSVADLLDVPKMTADIFKQVCPYITARSDVFRVRSFGVVGHPNSSSRAEFVCGLDVVLERNATACRIRYWRELE